MRYRKQDENGDYVFGAGNSSTFLTDLEAVAQAIETKLKLFQGEWWENENEGLPMLQEILGVHGANKSNADLLIMQRIKETPHVTGVSNASSTFDGSSRAYSFSCSVDTEYGSLAVTNQGGA